MRPIYDPEAETLDRTIKLNVSRRQLRDLDRFAQQFGMTRSWLLREALHIGLPAVVAHLRSLRSAGFRPKGQVASPSAAGPRRGPRTDGLREDRWIHRPNLTPEGRAFEYNDDDE